MPRGNAPSFEIFEEWLRAIAAAGTGESSPWSPPIAVNLSTRMEPDELEQHLRACTRHGVELIISATVPSKPRKRPGSVPTNYSKSPSSRPRCSRK